MKNVPENYNLLRRYLYSSNIIYMYIIRVKNMITINFTIPPNSKLINAASELIKEELEPEEYLQEPKLFKVIKLYSYVR